MDSGRVFEMFRGRIDRMNEKMDAFNSEKLVLKNLDLMVVDNTLRENALGHTRGHTMENKWKMYNEVKKCGIKHIAVAAFTSMTQTGEAFLRELKDHDEDLSDCFAFVECIDSDEPPIGLRKCLEYGIKNIILEIDLTFSDTDYTIYNAPKICAVLQKRFEWIRENLSADSLIIVNLRDFSETMKSHPIRVFYVVNFLGSLQGKERIHGIALEDEGKCFPEQVVVWTSCVREEMQKSKWDGQLLINIREQYGVAVNTALDCLSAGATGVLAGLSEEGAGMGHVSSSVAIMNLIRCGNTKVIERYQCQNLYPGSRAVTEIVTGQPVPPRQVVTGDRAVGGLCLGGGSVLDKSMNPDDPRFTVLSHKTPLHKIIAKLTSQFGYSGSFSEERAKEMKEVMLQDFKANIREDYNSKYGLSVLFDRSGGSAIPEMMDSILQYTQRESQLKALIAEVREMWDQWDIRDDTLVDDCLGSYAFYNGFLSPYFPGARNDEIRSMLEQIDLQIDGEVAWSRYLVHLQYAAGQYPDVSSADELRNIAFRESIVIGIIAIRLRESQKGAKFYKDFEFVHDSFFTGGSDQKQVSISVADEAVPASVTDEFFDVDASSDLEDDEISYQVIVKTSTFQTVSSDVQVLIDIYGRKGATGLRRLEGPSNNVNKVFNTDRRQMFQLDEKDVGELKKIRLQLVSNGSASWGVDWIAIKTPTEYLLHKCGKVIDLEGARKHNMMDGYTVRENMFFPEREEIPEIDYEVDIKTKNYEGFSADTASDVHITLFGNKGNSGKLKFELQADTGRKMFDKQRSHKFNFKAIDVGVLSNIRVTHANNEQTCKWLLEYVNVKSKGLQVEFPANQWLKKSSYTPQLYIDLFAKRKQEDEIKFVPYEVKVKTGGDEEADTTADISVILHGQHGNTGSTVLDYTNTTDKKIFGCGTANTFNFKAKDIGGIHRITVVHNPDGHGDVTNWYLENIVVNVGGESYAFTSSQWLAANTSVDMFPLVEDNKDNLVTYHVITQTGTVMDASTDANVYVIITGENGDSGKVLLDVRADYDMFEDGQEDVITVTAPEVGNIIGLVLGHDNEGRSPDWYVLGVDIIHPTCHQSVDFTANCWLGDSTTRRDGGEVECEVELFSVHSAEEGEVPYDIEIKTGNYEGPTANATLKICLVGQDINTGYMELEHPSGNNEKTFDNLTRHLFALNSIDIGDLYKIRITHSNPTREAKWYIDWVVVKTSMYYMKINVDKWCEFDERTGGLYLDIFPPEEDLSAHIKYQVILITGNYHGFDTDSDVDPAWLCLFGDLGNTGMINWRGQEDDKNELFGKNNKHYLTFEGPNIGNLNCVRFVHTNDNGFAEWLIESVTVKTDDYNIRIRNTKKEWMSKTECNGRLQQDFFPTRKGVSDLIRYNVTTVTGDCFEAGTTANVHVEFFGMYGETGKINLDTSSTNDVPFQTGKTDEFTVTAPDVGRITKICIGHDDSNPLARWWLRSVKVEVPSIEHSVNFVFARWLDTSQASTQRKCEAELFPLVENNPDNKVVYHISTKTADIPDASTDANVFAIIYGENGDTGKLQLDLLGKDYDLFEQDNEDVFTLTAPDVGPIKKIRMGHDDQGRSANWFLNWVHIICPDQVYTNIFYFNDWLSSREGKLQIETDLLPADFVEEDTITYDLTIMTENYHGFGCDYGNVKIILFGDDANTGPLCLHTPENDRDGLFDKSNKWMDALEGIDVGPVRKIKVIHDNKAGESTWKLKWMSIKTRESYTKFLGGEWLIKNELTGKLSGELYPKPAADLSLKKTYILTFMTKNFHSKGTEDPKVEVCLFGPKGNTGMVYIECPPDDPNQIFDKNNKQIFQIQADDVGEVTHLRVVHNNKKGVFQWQLQYVNVKVDDQSVKFVANKWLEAIPRGTALKIDLSAPVKMRADVIKYTFLVKTGDYPECSTKANPFIIVHGRHGETGKLLLEGGSFERNTAERFEVLAPDVGYVNKITLGHDNSHACSAWYVHSVNVKVVTKHYNFNFPIDRWFSKSIGDRRIEADFYPLPSANPDNEINYHISIRTANVYGGGTDAAVFAVLYGKSGETEPIKLDASDYDPFEQDKVDIFTVKALDVGELTHIKLGHNNIGRLADWFVQDVTIICPLHGYCTDVVVDRWLSDREGDYLTEGDFIPVPKITKESIHYDLTLQTNNYHGYGTDYGNVSVMLFGEREDTGLLTLETPPEDKDRIFDKSNKYRCVLEAPDVGEIRSIRIRHDNTSRACKWNLDWVTIKTTQYYLKFKCAGWLEEHEKDGRLRCDLFPEKQEEPDQKVQYQIFVMTKNYRGKHYGEHHGYTESDVYFTINGEKGNTGPLLMNPDVPGDCTARTRIFDKSNKHYRLVEADDVGPMKSISVVHNNEEGDNQWMIDFVVVKTPVYDVKFRSGQWLELADGKLKTEIKHPAKGGIDCKGKYNVKVKTGGFAGADTDANVFIVIHGAYGSTGKVILDREKAVGSPRVIFAKDSYDIFNFTDVDVGPIHKIRIGHDDTGEHPGWWVNRVIVESPSHEVGLFFTAKRWLTKSKDDQIIETDLYPFTTDNLANLCKYVIKTKTGDVEDGGTDADVFVHLYGNNGDTGRIPLESSSSTDLFERDREDSFVILAADVGHVHKITVGHNNEGTNPSWYLDKISVEVPNHNYTIDLPVQRWFKPGTADSGENTMYELKVDAKDYFGGGSPGINPNVLLFDEHSSTSKRGYRTFQRVVEREIITSHRVDGRVHKQTHDTPFKYVWAGE